MKKRKLSPSLAIIDAMLKAPAPVRTAEEEAARLREPIPAEAVCWGPKDLVLIPGATCPGWWGWQEVWLARQVHRAFRGSE